MNKTVTINISGIIFHIEEDAFESLSKYLFTIKGYFIKTDGGNEIMSDIEARIAELLQEKINVGKQVILMNDVEYVMNVMGKPEDFGGEQQKTDNTEQKNEQFAGGTEKIKRRLFRDPDEKAIGGVCSGLAAYFDVDIVWVRLAMFLLVFFGGISIWVYIILWIIIPEAKTTADKFAMRGESANINNIFKSFQEEAEDLKNRYSKSANNIRHSHYGEAVRNNISSTLNVVFNIAGRLIGLFFILIGGALLVAYLGSLTGISIADSNNDFDHWKSVLFESPSDYTLAILAFIIVAGIPVFMLLYGGIKLLFRIRYSNRWLNIALGVIWTIGLIIGFYITVGTVEAFNAKSHLKQTAELHGMGDTIIVKLNPAASILKSIEADNEDDLENYFNNNHSGYTFAEYNKQLGVIGYADLTVTESTSDSVELVIGQMSNGGTKREANENAREIKYHYKQQGNVLWFDEVFTVTPGVKFRAQEIQIRLKVPKGKVVYFDRSVKHLLNDVENKTNTWEGDMINRRWKMTRIGLECIDCDGLDEHKENKRHRHDDDDDNEKDIVILGDEIRTKDGSTEIRMDKEGIKIKSSDREVESKEGKKK